jgi:hypothetical protein
MRVLHVLYMGMGLTNPIISTEARPTTNLSS